MKECFYSILGVDKKSDDDVIKKAYRQMALRHHPDKQSEDQREAATAKFQLISEAYEVLSNKQERAWYDSHREQILRGDEEPGSGSGSHSTKQDIWKYFSTSCFSGKFDDSEGGFYKTYSELFEELASLERDDFSADSDDEQYASFPSFGSSRSEWEDVQSFYTQWSNFQSTRGFGGFNKWNLREGENRQIRRAMESENKKSRNAARKEYSAAVRSLVAFVKRRDVRVIEYQAKTAEIERLAKAKKEEAVRAKEEAKRIARETARQEDLKRWEEMEEQRRLNGEDEEGTVEEEEAEEDKEEFVCIACRKTFKSEKSYANHEGSKKHKQEILRLRKELMLSEDEFLEDHAPSSPTPVISERPPPTVVVTTDADQPRSPPTVSDYDALSPKLKSKKTKKAAKGRKSEADPDDVTPTVDVCVVTGVSVEETAQTRKPRRRRQEKKEPEGFACNTCNSPFPSKSALFRHLDESGHHLLVEAKSKGSKK